MKKVSYTRPKSAKIWNERINNQLEGQYTIINNIKQKKNVRIQSNGLLTQWQWIIPRQIYQDKERLLVEVQTLERNIEDVLQDNSILKSKLIIQEKQKQNMLRLMQKQIQLKKYIGFEKDNSQEKNVQKYRMSKYPPKNKIFFAKNMNKVLEGIQKQIQKEKKQSKRMKKIPKYFQVKELQTQIDFVIQHNMKINTINSKLEQLVKKSDQLKQQCNIEEDNLKYLMDENILLRQKNIGTEEEIKMIKQKIKIKQNDNEYKQNKIYKQIQIKNKELMEIKEKYANTQKEYFQLTGKSKTIYRKKNIPIYRDKNILQKKNQEQTKKKQNKNQMVEYKQNPQKIFANNYFSNRKNIFYKPNRSVQFSDQDRNWNDILQQKSDENFRPNKKILTQIKDQLTYKIHAQRITYGQFKYQLKCKIGSQISCQNLYNLLLKQPFFLKQSLILVVLQYCCRKQVIQMRQMDNINLNGQKIRNNLLKFVSKFTLSTKKQHLKALTEVNDLILQFSIQLKQSFVNVHKNPDKKTVRKRDCMKILQKMQLSNKCINMIVGDLLMHSHSINQLNLQLFWSIYQPSKQYNFYEEEQLSIGNTYNDYQIQISNDTLF